MGVKETFGHVSAGSKTHAELGWWECIDSGYIDSAKVQIPRDFFPEKAAYGGLGGDDTTYGAIERQSQSIYWDGSSAMLDVKRYPGPSRAKRGFTMQVRILDELFGAVSRQSPSQPKYQSVSADEFFAGCGRHTCVFVARYREDLVSFHMTIDGQMTLEDFDRILMYLDTVTAKGLGH